MGNSPLQARFISLQAEIPLAKTSNLASIVRMFRRAFSLLATLSLVPAVLTAQTPAPAKSAPAQLAPEKTVRLWPDGDLVAKSTEEKDQAILDIYPAPKDKATGSHVVICPGGGYGGLALGHEGRDIAEYLNGLGATAYVLHYRLGSKGYHHPVEMNDAKRALRWARLHSADYGCDTKKLGIWGFSAGGHLASTAAIHSDAGDPQAKDEVDKISSRPDFLILAYPVISMSQSFSHKGSVKNLLGDKNDDEELKKSLSGELQDLKGMPPTFLFTTWEDKGVPPQNSLEFALTLIRAGVPCELHMYQKGGHGLGLAPKLPETNTWPDRLTGWLKTNGFAK